MVLDGICENITSLVQLGMYGAINTYDTTADGLYVIKFLSDAYTLQNNTTIDGQDISTGKLVVKAQYLCSIQNNTNWYWKHQPLQLTIIVQTRTIIHQRLEFIMIQYVQDILRKLCGMNEEKKSIQGHPIIMTNPDYDFIMDEIERREKFSLKGM